MGYGIGGRNGLHLVGRFICTATRGKEERFSLLFVLRTGLDTSYLLLRCICS